LTPDAVRANVCSDAVTSQGHAYAQFHRALKTGNPILALDAARELNHITLEDALGLCMLLRKDARRYQHAAARWLARYHADVEGVTLADIREIADLLAALPVHGSEAGSELVGHLEARGLYRCATRVRELAIEPSQG
jgi:hypothetical protein